MGSIAVPPSGKKSEPLPLYFDNTASFIHYVGTGTDYTISANESRAFFITNGRKGQLKISFVYGDQIQLVKINSNGTTQNVSAGTFNIDGTVLGFTFKNTAGHITQYKFNFTY